QSSKETGRPATRRTQFGVDSTFSKTGTLTKAFAAYELSGPSSKPSMSSVLCRCGNNRERNWKQRASSQLRGCPRNHIETLPPIFKRIETSNFDGRNRSRRGASSSGSRASHHSESRAGASSARLSGHFRNIQPLRHANPPPAGGAQRG